MPRKQLVRIILLGALGGGLYSPLQSLAAVQVQSNAPADSWGPESTKMTVEDAQAPPTASRLAEVIDRMIAREHEEIKAIERYTPIIETYIQEVKPNSQLGIVPKTDIYFLGQANFRGRLKVHSSIDHGRKGSFLWSYDPAGFLIFVDRGEFDRAHYKFEYVRWEFQGDVRCYVFDVTPAAKPHGARFDGRIWVEEQDFTIVHIKGTYTPAVRFSFRSFEGEYYLHFDSWRTNVKSGQWLPSHVYSQEPADELQRSALQIADATVGL